MVRAMGSVLNGSQGRESTKKQQKNTNLFVLTGGQFSSVRECRPRETMVKQKPDRRSKVPWWGEKVNAAAEGRQSCNVDTALKTAGCHPAYATWRTELDTGSKKNVTPNVPFCHIEL